MSTDAAADDSDASFNDYLRQLFAGGEANESPTGPAPDNSPNAGERSEPQSAPSQSAISDLRDLLAANPELEQKLRERLLERPDREPLRRFLNRPPSPDYWQRAQQALGAEPRSNAPDSSSGSRGASSRQQGSGAPTAGANPLADRGKPANGSRTASEPDTARPLDGGTAQSREPNERFPAAPQRPSATGPNGARADSSGSRAGQGSAASGGRADDPWRRRFSLDSDRSSSQEQSSSKLPGVGTSPPEPDREAPTAAPNRRGSATPIPEPSGSNPRRPSRRETNQGSGSSRDRASNAAEDNRSPWQPKLPSDSSSNDSSSGDSAASSSNKDPRMQAASGESLRDRFNRILMKAVDGAQDDKSAKAGSSTGAAEDAGFVESLLNQFAVGLQETMRDPETKRSLREALRKSRESLPNVDVAPTTTPGLGELANQRNWNWLALPFLLLVAIALAAFLLNSPPVKRTWQRWIDQYASPLSKTRDFEVGRCQSPVDLVRTVDRFVVWRFGYAAHWWHAGEVTRRLDEAYPEDRSFVRRLMSDYQAARYAPRQIELSAEVLQQAPETLRQWKSQHLEAQDAARLSRAVVS